MCSASPTDTWSTRYHSPISLWVSSWSSPLLLKWFHVSPVWSVQGTQDPVWLLVLHVTAPRLLQCLLTPHICGCFTYKKFLTLSCGLLWANSIKQRQGQAQFQVLGAVVFPMGEAGGSGWAMQVGTVQQSSAFSSTWGVTTGWWTPAQAHTSSLEWEKCVFLSVHLWWVAARATQLNPDHLTVWFTWIPSARILLTSCLCKITQEIYRKWKT